MIVPLTLLFGALGYLCYTSKDEFLLIEKDNIDSTIEKNVDDDLYKSLEDLFI